MGALIAIGSIFVILWAKHHATASAGVPASATGSGGARITGAADPLTAYDPNTPAQGDAIGNTHLSIMDPIFTPGGDIVSLPYRPSDLAYGGGVQAAVGTFGDANPSGSSGGTSAIEILNAPHAQAGLSRSVSRLPNVPWYSRGFSQLRLAMIASTPGPANRGTGSGAVLKATHAVPHPSLGTVAGSGAPALRAANRAIASAPTTPAAAGTPPQSSARTNFLLAGRRLSVA
jgi:hypothetical protein